MTKYVKVSEYPVLPIEAKLPEDYKYDMAAIDECKRVKKMLDDSQDRPAAYFLYTKPIEMRSSKDKAAPKLS